MCNRPVFTNIESSLSEASAMLLTYGFRKFISNVNLLTFEKKFKKFYFEIEFLNMFQCERGLRVTACRGSTMDYASRTRFGVDGSSRFRVRCNIYVSRLCYDLSVCLSVTEVHWRIIAKLGFKFRSKFSAHCGRGKGSSQQHLALC